MKITDTKYELNPMISWLEVVHWKTGITHNVQSSFAIYQVIAYCTKWTVSQLSNIYAYNRTEHIFHSDLYLCTSSYAYNHQHPPTIPPPKTTTETATPQRTV